MFSSKDLFFTPAASGAYTVSKSLRFRSSASAYLNRTFGSPTSGTTFTYSMWVKRGTLGAQQTLVSATRPGNFDRIVFSASDTLYVQFNDGSSNLVYLETTQVFRDPSAWYHIVIAFDTTQATSSNRIKIYVNGSQVTVFSTATYPAQNTTSYLNANAVAVNLGRLITATNYLDGYLAESYLIDGSQKAATDFGAYDTNGIWQPAAYTGSYGTNGFYLKFTDVGATSGSNTGYGKDFAGTNYWTTNNFGTTSTATTYDSMLDSPTNATGDIGNYAVFNPLIPSTGTISNGNLYVSTTTTNATSGTILQTSGKWYAEVYINSNGGSSSYIRVGVCNSAGVGADLGGSANGWAYLGDARVYNNGSTSSYGVTSTTGDTINVALDLDNGKVWYGKNGTWMASGNPATGANPSQTFTANQSMTFAVAAGSGTPQYYINFGQIPFSTAAPSGFSALNTQNLTTPTITNGAQYMAASLWTGTGPSATTIPLGAFTPDLVWWKSRSNAEDHHLIDTVRGKNGGTYYASLSSNLTAAEDNTSSGDIVTNISSSGLTVDNLNGTPNVNGRTYVGWNWNAGGSTVSGTGTGGITNVSYRANPTAGFSVVTYTGSGANGTVTHGLGAAPSMVIVKKRSSTGNWQVYHTSLTSAAYAVQLNLTAAQASTPTTWNSTAPTSSVFSVGTDSDTNSSTVTYVAYCFAPVAGYSAMGLWQNNNSTDGTFTYLGFRPRAILFKNSDNVENWYFIDTSRNTYNVAPAGGNWLQPNTSASETTAATNVTTAEIDILSNGFKIRTTNPSSGEVSFGTRSYVYAAWAENPFKIARAR